MWEVVRGITLLRLKGGDRELRLAGVARYTSFRWSPHPVIVTIRDNKEYIPRIPLLQGGGSPREIQGDSTSPGFYIIWLDTQREGG